MLQCIKFTPCPSSLAALAAHRSRARRQQLAQVSALVGSTKSGLRGIYLSKLRSFAVARRLNRAQGGTEEELRAKAWYLELKFQSVMKLCANRTTV